MAISFIKLILFVQAVIKLHVKSNENRTGQQGTKVHLQLPTNLLTLVINELQVSRNVYTIAGLRLKQQVS